VIAAVALFAVVLAPKPTVWIVDGAGGSAGCSTHFHAANRSAGAPFAVRVFPWHHESQRYAPDQRDGAHARAMGERLAAAIRAESGPPLRVVAFSAGVAVALAAAERLPAGSLQRIVLLAPSVTSRYPLDTPARAAIDGVDVFVSSRDVWVQRTAVRLFGAADRRHGIGAGLNGFDSVPANVRQQAWRPEWKALGHDGGHFGAHAPEFLRAVVFPRLAE
jgi:alpha-beta hydrolase superfamily lysophospholipase